MPNINESFRQAHSMLAFVTDDLEIEIEDRYRSTKDHPAIKRRYDRDMEIIRKARKVLRGEYEKGR